MKDPPGPALFNALEDDDGLTLTAANFDRRLPHAHIVQLNGDSYRLKDKCQAGVTRSRAVAGE